MSIPTEPIGSIPRAQRLFDAIVKFNGAERPELNELYEDAVRETIAEFEATGEPARVLRIIRDSRKPHHRIFIGGVAPIDPQVERPELIRDQVLESAGYIPPEQLGTTDDCNFSPFCDDRTTSRKTAFAKIRARVVGTALAAEILGGS